MKYRARLITVYGHTFFYIQRKALFVWRFVKDRRCELPRLFNVDEMNEYMSEKEGHKR